MVRPLLETDIGAVAQMCAELWPDGSAEEHGAEIETVFREAASGPYPSAVFVADDGSDVVGFVLVGMRSHADGCDPFLPVGYIEGWFVREGWRSKGFGRALIHAAENWAREQGCVEMASDTWVTNVGSQDAHTALGYEEVDRCVNYRKKL